jgi:hypothetical protein
VAIGQASHAWLAGQLARGWGSGRVDAPSRGRRSAWPPSSTTSAWPTGGPRAAASPTALQQAPPAIKRQVFDAFGLLITYDKLGRRIEISAIISEATADALENAKNLPEEALDRSDRSGLSAGGLSFRARRTRSRPKRGR